jgi:OOP family OmpA-OmpF porin
MKKSLAVLALASAGLLLGACSASNHVGPVNIQSLRNAKLADASAAGSPFTAALTSEYRVMTLEAADKEFDWPNAYVFADKGLAAAKGWIPLPEDPAARDLDPAVRDDMTKRRKDFVALLEGGARQRMPDVAAKAQAKFDCWVEEAEEGWQLAEIEGCRSVFIDLAARLVPAPAVSAVREFRAYFEWSSSQLTPDGVLAVQLASDYASTSGALRIALVGHADRSGPENYNMALSMKRAMTVADALVARGIARDRIHVRAVGESETPVATPDGVREPMNRVVEVTVR